MMELANYLRQPCKAVPCRIPDDAGSFAVARTPEIKINRLPDDWTSPAPMTLDALAGECGNVESISRPLVFYDAVGNQDCSAAVASHLLRVGGIGEDAEVVPIMRRHVGSTGNINKVSAFAEISGNRGNPCLNPAIPAARSVRGALRCNQNVHIRNTPYSPGVLRQTFALRRPSIWPTRPWPKSTMTSGPVSRRGS